MFERRERKKMKKKGIIVNNKSRIQDTQTIRERIKQGYIGKSFKLSERM